MARTAALLLLLFGVYASTLGLDAFGDSNYGGDEPHYLLAAESLKRDRDVDVTDEYVAKAYSAFYPYELDQHGVPTEGRLNEPHGVGFPLFILPAYLIAGAHGVEIFLALIAALAVALAYRLALRVVPDPWALGAAAAVGLSPPFVAYGTAIYPELTAGACLAGAALLALRLDEHVSRRDAFFCFVLLGFLPWLGTKFVPAGLVIGFLAARGLWRARRRTPLGRLDPEAAERLCASLQTRLPGPLSPPPGQIHAEIVPISRTAESDPRNPSIRRAFLHPHFPDPIPDRPPLS